MALKRIIDLTHTITGDMPVYPGTDQPELKAMTTCEKDGFKETLLTIWSHVGTHMDAPAHIFPGRTTLDAFPAEQFCGTALVIDCTGLKAGERITMDFIDRVKEKAAQAEFILFHTGWDVYWGGPEYFGDYPYITGEVAEYLIADKKKGVGLDVIGIDPIADANLTIHRRLFAETEIVVIENLTNLKQVGGELFTLCALPLKYGNADGAPVRAVALLPGDLI